MVMGFSLLVFLLTSWLFSSFYINYAKDNLTDSITELNWIVGNRAVEYIQEDDHSGLESRLSNLKAMQNINYIHIYNITPKKQEIEFFASYNRSNDKALPPISPQISRIDQLALPLFSEDKAELISPIERDSILLGYAYIQINLERLSEIKNQLRLATAGIGIGIVLISFWLIRRFSASIEDNIQELVETVQRVSNKKDFSLRCQSTSYKEIDILSRNINIMLSRTEKHILKQDKAEQEILKLNHELEDKVNQRTNALKESNHELLSTLEKLHQFQGQLVENEKMASLGDMVAGIAHEVNTPIGLGVTASSLLSDRLREVDDAYQDQTLKGSQLKKFLGESRENVKIIRRNLNRAADLISSFKQVAVDQSSEENRLFDVKELVNEVCLSLAPELRDKNYNVNIDCPNDLVINSKPGPLNQVLINLIMNSKIHGFDNGLEGDISITAMQLGQQLNIIYKDNGKGVDESVKGKIFEPFVTTKRGEGGSGLGLHLVYNLITQALGGTISIESEPGKGVTFEINIPIS